MPITKEDYQKAIVSLKSAMTQIDPDGNNCAVCGDNDHQAWECHHNPLSRNYLYREHWRCYHCNEVFYDPKEAELHFGWKDNDPPACKNKLAFLLRWARQIKEKEIKNRPDVNIYKRTILTIWTQVINKIEDLYMTTSKAKQ